MHWVGLTKHSLDDYLDHHHYGGKVPEVVRDHLGPLPLVETLCETDDHLEARRLRSRGSLWLVGRVIDPDLLDEFRPWHLRPSASDAPKKSSPTTTSKYFGRSPQSSAPPSDTWGAPVEAVGFDVPYEALIDAIRLRTLLTPYAEIAQRLNERHANGHTWQPGEVRSMVAAAFTAWPRDPTKLRRD